MDEPDAAQSPSVASQQRRLRWWKWGAVCVGVALLVSLGRCGAVFVSARKKAPAAVDEIHRKVAAGECVPLWDGANPSFRSAMTRDELVVYCHAIAGKLGAVRETKLSSETVLNVSGGYLVTMRFDTRYDAGPAVETFTFSSVDGALSLMSYNVATPRLAD